MFHINLTGGIPYTCIPHLLSGAHTPKQYPPRAAHVGSDGGNAVDARFSATSHHVGSSPRQQIPLQHVYTHTYVCVLSVISKSHS